MSGISYNMATSGGTGGNTTTAAAGRKVYGSPELRGRLLDLVPPRFKFVMDQIMTNSKFCITAINIISAPSDNLLLRVMSCDLLICLDKLGRLHYCCKC